MLKLECMKSLEKMNIKNLILKNLSETIYCEIESHLEEVEMLLTEYLYLPKEKIKYIYFPETIFRVYMSAIKHTTSHFRYILFSNTKSKIIYIKQGNLKR